MPTMASTTWYMMEYLRPPFTWVQTNFCTDKFSWTACLHGSVQILLQVAVVFTWLRANFKTIRFSFGLLLLLS